MSRQYDNIHYSEIIKEFVPNYDERYYQGNSSWIEYKQKTSTLCDGHVDLGGDKTNLDHPQGYKFHIGFHDKDIVTGIRAILPFLIQYDIKHKILASLTVKQSQDYDKNSTQYGKHIAIYSSKITPRILKDASEGRTGQLNMAIELAKFLYRKLDDILYDLIIRKRINSFTPWSKRGEGTDKVWRGSKSKMVGYRLGSFCDKNLYGYDKRRKEVIQIDDDRSLYKNMNTFRNVTFTNRDDPDPFNPDEVYVERGDYQTQYSRVDAEYEQRRYEEERRRRYEEEQRRYEEERRENTQKLRAMFDYRCNIIRIMSPHMDALYERKKHIDRVPEYYREHMQYLNNALQECKSLKSRYREPTMADVHRLDDVISRLNKAVKYFEE